MKTRAHAAHGLRNTVLAVGLLATPAVSWACCPSDGNTGPKASTGLGDAVPPAADLAADPAWRVYEFERNGVRYVQINDADSRPRAAAGRIDGLFWTLPVGSDADRVVLPGQPVPAGAQRVLFRSGEVEVVLIDTGTAKHWLIRPPSTP